MHEDGPVGVRVFRVVVRGQFRDLTGEQRRALLAEAEAHDYLRSAFTVDGTFTYDRRLVSFNLRYEVRLADETDGDDSAGSGPRAAGDPVEIGLAHARTDLTSWGLAWKHLRATAVDMADLWSP